MPTQSPVVVLVWPFTYLSRIGPYVYPENAIPHLQVKAVRRGTDQANFGVEDHMDGDIREHVRETPLVTEGSTEIFTL